MDWKIGDNLVFGMHGVCEITDVQTEKDGTKDFVLSPVFDKRTRIMVPVECDALAYKMRPVLSKDEVTTLIKHMPETAAEWIQNENARKETYKEILKNGDRLELIAMIRTLYQQQQKQRAKGKRLYRVDEKFLKDASKMLHEEFAFVLGISPQEVEEYVTHQLNPEA